MQEGGAGTGRGVDGNQNAVHFAGGGALLGVLSPAALHDDKENGRERCGAWREWIRDFGCETILDEGHEDSLIDALKRSVAKRQFPKYNAESVHVSEGIGRGAVEQLGRRPLYCALHAVRLGRLHADG
jgi:hypothetical protein